MRTFLGIKIPATKEISEFVKEIKSTNIDAKFVEQENYHINLKFFGNKSEEEISKIVSATEKVASKFHSFKLFLSGAGVFPSKSFVRVVWIGINSNELEGLYNMLENKFEEIGIPKESRKFTPHLTICRLRSQENKNILIDKLSKFNSKGFGEFDIKSIYLFESKLSPKGPKYNILKEFRLGK